MKIDLTQRDKLPSPDTVPARQVEHEPSPADASQSKGQYMLPPMSYFKAGGMKRIKIKMGRFKLSADHN